MLIQTGLWISIGKGGGREGVKIEGGREQEREEEARLYTISSSFSLSLSSSSSDGICCCFCFLLPFFAGTAGMEIKIT